jgi:hypothetical protein
MNATRFITKAAVGDRRAMHLRVDRYRVTGETQIDNGRLIFGGIAAENPGFEHGEGVAIRRRLNAFFAISVNSPSMSMVNFCCCVCSALSQCACGVTRRVTPQPMRAAVRMEAGVHACL